MGCMSDRDQGAAANAQNSRQKKAEHAKSAAAPAPLKKLTPEQIALKRQQMRYNLQEGNSQPPNLNPPLIANVTTFDAAVDHTFPTITNHSSTSIKFSSISQKHRQSYFSNEVSTQDIRIGLLTLNHI